MAKKKNVKRTLAASLISMALCGAMLVGSTYAWFTDTATTGKNTITAGNLDVELEYSLDNQDWQDASSESLVTSNDPEKWEPGVMKVSKYFRVTNDGDLALQYQLSLEVDNEETTNYNGHTLDEVIQIKIVDLKTYQEEAAKLENETPGQPDAAARKELWDNLTDAGYADNGVILPGSEADTLEQLKQQAVGDEYSDWFAGSTDALVMVLYWEPNSNEVDNQYNVKNQDSEEDPVELKIGFNVNVFATQTPYERDSFGPYYDANAMAQHAIIQAVTEGIAGAQASIEAALAEADIEDLEGAITVEPLAFNQDTGAYETTFTFSDKINGSNAVDALGAAYNAMKNEISVALYNELDNVTSVAIGDQEVTLEVEDADELAANLENALRNAFDLSDLETGEMTITVVVTDIGGTDVTYNLMFDLTQTEIFNG